MGRPQPEAWGVLPGHHDVRGGWVPAPETGVLAALAAMGADQPTPPEAPTWVIRQDGGLELPWPADLLTEDGDTVRMTSGVAANVPLGYHRLEPLDGSPAVRLIVSPGRCPIPARMWGWAVQLYAARSRRSWGMGDLGDLRRLASWRQAGGMLLVNPLHAVAPTVPQQPSPYSPASRRWSNPIYLRVEDVPGVEALGPGVMDAFARDGFDLNAARIIDRDAVWALKRSALEQIWACAPPARGFEEWARAQGSALTGFATWASIADEYGPDWRAWPEDLQRPDSPVVATWRDAHDGQVRFHAWLQWLVRLQVDEAAAAGPALVSDLAIGVDGAGADAWLGRDWFASGVTIGAPPDEFNPEGQDWGLPPFDPWKLRAAGYEPFAEIIRTALSTGGGVRVDHVAGLFRSFWVPSGGPPSEGVYVRYPWEDLLHVLSLEAHRAHAFVIGEDLGTIEPWVRDALAAAGILSYRLLCFEDQPPERWPELALGAVSTHDLPTMGGMWTGADDDARREMGLPVDADASARIRQRFVAAAGPECANVADAAEVLPAIYRRLSAAPPVVVVGSLEDALGVIERPNHPGSIDEWPNWRISLPVPLEEIEVDPGVQAAGAALASSR